jgi:hypothetical protein
LVGCDSVQEHVGVFFFVLFYNNRLALNLTLLSKVEELIMALGS